MPTPSSAAGTSSSPSDFRPRTVAFVTGTRADFGLMLPVLRAIATSPKLRLRVYATGMHLMPELGNTIAEVEAEFPDAIRLPATFAGDTREAMAAFSSSLLSLLVPRLAEDRPDILLTLGDRPEMLCAAHACLYLGIPTAHVHGGDVTSTVDEVARHAITKLSHLHFPATPDSAERILKMGEEPWRVHVVGAPALDRILNEPLPSREELFSKLSLDPRERILLVTQHAVSGEEESAAAHMEETLSAAKRFALPVVVMYPNADAGGRRMIEVIERERNNPRFRILPHLPHLDFLALEREAAAWIGNSSAAMIESASFKTPVVNVGTRQLGRIRGGNVIDAPHDREAIASAIARALDDAFRASFGSVTNPWGDGATGPRVARILEEIVVDSRLLSKRISY